MVCLLVIDWIPLPLELFGWLLIFLLIAGRRRVGEWLGALHRFACVDRGDLPRWLHPLCVQDLRSLAAARIGLALLILVDVALRCRDLQAHYGDLGVLPRGALLQHFSNAWHWSLHFYSGLTSAQGVLFFCQAIIALALLVGYRTRLAVVLSWVLLVSLHHRNWLILQSGDTLLRCLLFFAMFLPMGARWSMDSAFGKDGTARDSRWCSWGGAGWTLQVMIVYWCSLIHKWHPAWHKGFAVEMAVHLESFATPLAVWARDYPAMLSWLTHGTLVIEALGPLLLLIPFRNGLNRTLAVFLMLGFHTSISLFLEVGLFGWIMAVAWLFFLPGSFWKSLDGLLRARSPEELEIFYHGGGVCSRWGATVLRGLAGLPRDCLRDARGDPEMHALCARDASWIVRSGESRVLHRGYDALLVVMEHSPVLGFFQPLAAWRPVARCGDFLQRRLAGLLHFNPALPAWLHPAAALPVKNGWYALGQVTAFAALIYVALWNLRYVDAHDAVNKHFKKPLGITGNLPLGWFDAFKPIGWVGGLEQGWNIFSPHPPTSDGWFVIRGVTVGGEELDLYNRGRFVNAESGVLNWSRPEQVSRSYVRQRWRKYLRKLPRDDFQGHRLWFGRWLTRVHNAHRSGDDRIESFEIWFVRRDRIMDGRLSEPTRISLHKHDCLP